MSTFSDTCNQFLKCIECGYVECPEREFRILNAFYALRPFPIHKLRPVNPLRPFQPYKSKYFDDHRYDPPREITAEDIIRAYENLRKE